MNHGSLFSGIGGFDLAAQWNGWTNVFQVEIDKFCQKVLAKHFPNTRRFLDIKEFDGTQFRGQVDVISGGFPCQPYSLAGKRKGKDDDRALWPEMLRVIKEIQPAWVVGENVGGFVNMGLDESISDLESEGYEVQAFIIPACAVNAPHRRDRVWIVAHNTASVRYGEENEIQAGRNGSISTDRHATDTGCERQTEYEKQTTGIEQHVENVTDTSPIYVERCERESRQEQSGGSYQWTKNWYEVAARFCRMDDGVSNRVDRLKSLGNSIVPQVAYEIFKAIKDSQ